MEGQLWCPHVLLWHLLLLWCTCWYACSRRRIAFSPNCSSLVFAWMGIDYQRVVLLVSSARLLQYLPRPWQRLTRAGVDKNFGLRQSGSLRSKDPNPSAVFQATTLQNLIPSAPSRQKV